MVLTRFDLVESSGATWYAMVETRRGQNALGTAGGGRGHFQPYANLLACLQFSGRCFSMFVRSRTLPTCPESLPHPLPTAVHFCRLL